MSFHVGQKVVCVSDIWDPRALELLRLHPFPGDPICIGAIYTVSWIGVRGGTLMLDLDELYSPEDDYWFGGYIASDFRPVLERKTSIEIFTRMLTPKQLEVVS